MNFSFTLYLLILSIYILILYILSVYFSGKLYQFNLHPHKHSSHCLKVVCIAVFFFLLSNIGYYIQTNCQFEVKMEVHFSFFNAFKIIGQCKNSFFFSSFSFSFSLSPTLSLSPLLSAICVSSRKNLFCTCFYWGVMFLPLVYKEVF